MSHNEKKNQPTETNFKSTQMMKLRDKGIQNYYEYDAYFQE